MKNSDFESLTFLFFSCWLASSARLYLYVAENGKRVLLITSSGCVLLWECLELKNILSSKSLPLVGQWSQIIPEEAVLLPSPKDKEAVVDAVFVRNEVKSTRNYDAEFLGFKNCPIWETA